MPIDWSDTSPAALPSASSTSESSLIWDRLIAGSRLPRWPRRNAWSTGTTVRSRLAITNRLTTSIHSAMSHVGTGMDMPRPTKNSVTKKSRRLVTLAMTSSVYGNVDTMTPATSAPISGDSPEVAREAGQREAPRERAHEHQFRLPRDEAEDRRQHEAARDIADADEERDLRDGEREHRDLRVLQVRLHGEEDDDEEILQHEDAERDAARERVEFALVVEDLDDDDGGTQRHRHAQVERLEPAGAEPHQSEEQPA